MPPDPLLQRTLLFSSPEQPSRPELIPQLGFVCLQHKGIGADHANVTEPAEAAGQLHGKSPAATADATQPFPADIQLGLIRLLPSEFRWFRG